MNSYSMPLAELLDGYVDQPTGQRLAADDVVVRGLTQDSRQLEAGDGFVALAGQTQHGLNHLGQAAAVGCASVLYEPENLPVNADDELHSTKLSAYPVESLAQNLGALADRFFREPSADLLIIGVTGTNGKSSFVHLLGHSLDAAGRRCGTLGTLGYGLVGQARPAPLTTPDAITVQRELAAIRDRNGELAVMEVSSHALEQGRVNGVRFAAAVFTNLSRDHLDYHGSMQAYGAAKARLFDWPGLRFAIINADDAFAAPLTERLGDDVSMIDYGIESGQVRATDIVTSSRGLKFHLNTPWGEVDIASTLVGRFNVLNLLAVAATLGALETPLEKIRTLLEQAQPVPGRMQVFGDNGQPLVVVDYAHTPAALEHALQALREHCAGRLVCVFGCGGDRDRGKRALMGEVAERLADGVVITDDNPRGEDGDAIVAEILAGLSQRNMALIERNRADAIQVAINTAEAGDVVLIAGKGHEDYQEIAGQRHPFDDREVVAAVLSGAAA